MFYIHTVYVKEEVVLEIFIKKKNLIKILSHTKYTLSGGSMVIVFYLSTFSLPRFSVITFPLPSFFVCSENLLDHNYEKISRTANIFYNYVTSPNWCFGY